MIQLDIAQQSYMSNISNQNIFSLKDGGMKVFKSLNIFILRILYTKNSFWQVYQPKILIPLNMGCKYHLSTLVCALEKYLSFITLSKILASIISLKYCNQRNRDRQSKSSYQKVPRSPIRSPINILRETPKL